MSNERPYGLYRQDDNTMPRIDSIWAFVSIDPVDKNEGVVTVAIGNTMMPMIAADEERLAYLKPIAEGMTVFSGMKIKLVKFSQREEVETYGT